MEHTEPHLQKLNPLEQAGAKAIDAPAPEDLSLNPTEQKMLVNALKILQNASSIAGQGEVADTARTLCWAVRCMGFLQSTPREALAKLNMPVTDLSSLGQYIITVKKTVDYFTIPLRLINAAMESGLLEPSLRIFLPPEAMTAVTAVAGAAKGACAISSIIELGKQWQSPQQDNVRFTQSLSLVGAAVSNYFGYTDTRRLLTILSCLMGGISTMQEGEPAARKKEQTVIDAITLQFDALTLEVKTLIEAQFEEGLAKLEGHPDEFIRNMLTCDLIEQQSNFKGHLADAVNEYQLDEIVTAYRDVFLPGALENGLVEVKDLGALEQLRSKISAAKEGVEAKDVRTRAAVASYRSDLSALQMRIISNPKKSPANSKVTEALLEAITDRQNTISSQCNRLWLTSKVHSSEPDPIKRLSIAEREAAWIEIAQRSAPGALDLLENSISKYEQSE